MKSNTKQTIDAPKRRPSRDPDIREQQLIGYAVDLAEKRLREGTASSAEVVHFLKLGSSSSRLDREKAQKEIQLMDAKIKSIENQENISTLYAEAIQALREYRGQSDGTD